MRYKGTASPGATHTLCIGWFAITGPMASQRYPAGQSALVAHERERGVEVAGGWSCFISEGRTVRYANHAMPQITIAARMISKIFMLLFIICTISTVRERTVVYHTICQKASYRNSALFRIYPQIGGAQHFVAGIINAQLCLKTFIISLRVGLQTPIVRYLLSRMVLWLPMARSLSFPERWQMP